MNFKIEDEKQLLVFNSEVSNDITLLLKEESSTRIIGKIFPDESENVYVAVKKIFRLKRVSGFSVNFFILAYVQRLDFICNDVLYRISTKKALNKGSLIYAHHQNYEQQLFIQIENFIEFQRVDKEWKAKKS